MLCRRATTRAGAAILRWRSAAHPFVLFTTGDGGGYWRVGGWMIRAARSTDDVVLRSRSWELVGGRIGDAAGRPGYG